MSANVNIEARAPKDIEPEYAELWERAVEVLEMHRKWTPAEPEAAPPADLNARHTVQTCVHPYALQRSGRCEGCGVYPLVSYVHVRLSVHKKPTGTGPGLSAAEQPSPKTEAAQLREFALRTVRPFALALQILAQRRLRVLGKLQALLGSTSCVLRLCQPLDKRVHVHGRTLLRGPRPSRTSAVHTLVYGVLWYLPAPVYVAAAL